MKRGSELRFREGIRRALTTPKTLPTWDKPAGERCQHQRHTGCAVYDKRPVGCRVWSCRWLTGQDTASLRRPDRAGYVLDMIPDFVRICQDSDPDGQGTPLKVIQLWVDPRRPDAWRQDPGLRAYIERRADENTAILVRLNAHDAFTVIVMADGWHEIGGGRAEQYSTWPGQEVQKIAAAGNAIPAATMPRALQSTEASVGSTPEPVDRGLGQGERTTPKPGV